MKATLVGPFTATPVLPTPRSSVTRDLRPSSYFLSSLFPALYSPPTPQFSRPLLSPSTIYFFLLKLLPQEHKYCLPTAPTTFQVTLTSLGLKLKMIHHSPSSRQPLLPMSLHSSSRHHCIKYRNPVLPLQLQIGNSLAGLFKSASAACYPLNATKSTREQVHTN